MDAARALLETAMATRNLMLTSRKITKSLDNDFLARWRARLNFAPRVAGPVAQLCFDGSRRLEGAHLTCLQSKQHNNILRSYYESSESLSDEP